MLTVEKLNAFGANTAEGIARCINNEAFYLRMVDMAMSDANFGKLETAIHAGDKDAAFEAAHALKGVLGNLSLTPILDPVVEITELLRARAQTDYKTLIHQIREARDELARICEE